MAVFASLAFLVGVPQGPEGELIRGSLQTQVQLALLGLAAAGLAIALRWRVPGGLLMVLAATGIGVFAAFEYRPLAALGPFLALLVPALALIALSLGRRHPAWTVAAAAMLVLLLTGAGVAAQRTHDYVFGPTHPGSAAAGLPHGDVEWVWSGGARAHDVRVTARLAREGARARLVVAESPDLSGSRRIVPASARSDDGRVAAFAVSGLRPATRYFYAVEVDGRVDRAWTGRVRTAPVGPASFTVALGACARRGSNGAVFDAIRREDPAFFLTLGDMYYADISGPDPGRFRDALDLALSRPGRQALHLQTPTAYVWDDHDFGPNDADRTSPARGAAQRVYREYVPHYPLAGGAQEGPIFQAFTWGRARFVLMDLRSERDPPTQADPSMLGAAQRRWLEGELLRARDRGQLVVLVSSVPWIDPATPGSDTWAGYAAERRELSSFIARHRIGGVVMIAGDAHMIAIEDGSHTDYSGTGLAGFPLMHAAALDRHSEVKGGPYSEGVYGGGGQYGTLEVRDDGLRMAVTLRGRDWTGRRLASYSFEVPGR